MKRGREEESGKETVFVRRVDLRNGDRVSVFSLSLPLTLCLTLSLDPRSAGPPGSAPGDAPGL